jgi:hypothetical protein
LFQSRFQPPGTDGWQHQNVSAAAIENSCLPTWIPAANEGSRLDLQRRFVAEIALSKPGACWAGRRKLHAGVVELVDAPDSKSENPFLSSNYKLEYSVT